MTKKQIQFKIDDNKAIIISKVNRKRLAQDWRAPLLAEKDVDSMIKQKMKRLGCSELEATELLKKELVR